MLETRDRAVAAWQKRHPRRNTFEDRALEVTSEIPVPLADQIRAIGRTLGTGQVKERNMKTKILLAFSLAGGVVFAGEAAAGDAAKGKLVFARCTSCHSNQADVARLGPSLFGVLGRVPGTLASFKIFSPAMKAFGESGKVWDEANLDAYLANPKTFVPGNRMAFVGVPKAEERADLIAYLKTLKAD